MQNYAKTPKSVAQWLAERAMSPAELAKRSSLDDKIVEAIAAGRYTTSPQQRQRVADALGVHPQEVAWGHAVSVDHMYGHGPQFGRSP